MKTKIQIKSTSDSLLFEFEKEENTIKDTLIEAIKSGANLSGAYLSGAYLSGAYLYGANLYGANLPEANLYGADLSGAYLSEANLYGAYLYGANLSGANLSEANLSGAYLSGANLSGANLSEANLYGAYYRNIKIKKLFLSNTLYTYLAGSIISEDNKQYIILGCHCRLVSDWERDFWNNNSEFPNDGSEKSENRKRAFNVCNAWIENYK